MKRILLLLFIGLWSAQAFSSDIYQCVENGVKKFSQTPCGAEAQLYLPRLPLMETANPHPLSNDLPVVDENEPSGFAALSQLKVSKEACEVEVVNGHYRGNVKNSHRSRVMEAKLRLIFEFEKGGVRQDNWDNYLKFYRLNPGQEVSFDIRSRIMPPHSKAFCLTEWQGRLLE